MGIIDELARGIVLWTEGDYVTAAILILWISGLFSGIVDNIPFVAAMIPVIEEFESYGMVYLDPIWWSLALGACMGGNATLIGASANVVVAGLAEGEGEKLSFCVSCCMACHLSYCPLLLQQFTCISAI